MASESSMIGKYIGKYKIEKLLGRGGMAEVFKARQENLDRDVAIKLMHPFLAEDDNFLSRFKREARTMASIDHPNIIDVYDFDAENDRYYIVMQFLGGGSLKDRQDEYAAKGEIMPLADSVRTMLEVSDALAYAHSRGLIHRDIKPANIMYSSRGRSILTDFGIAKLVSGPTFTATGAMVGTPAYMSPEQGMGSPGDERSDIYALGVMFYQMTTGRLPHDADAPLAVLLKHMNEVPVNPTELNPTLPESIENVVLKAMAKDPDDRFQKPTEMARELRHALSDSDNMQLRVALPSGLLEDRPTPLPGKTFRSDPDDSTRLVMANESTAVAPGMPVEATAVADPSALPLPEPAAGGGSRRGGIPMWVWGLLAFLVLGGGGAFAAFTLGGDDPTPTPTTEAVAMIGSDTPEPTIDVRDGDDEDESVDTQATIDALVNIINNSDEEDESAAVTETPEPTDVPTATPTNEPTSTPTLTPSPTIDAEAATRAACTYGFNVENVYTYRTTQNTAAPIGNTFPLTFVLSNSGTCEWPSDLQLAYFDGNELSQSGPVPVTSTAPGEEVSVQVSLVAPSNVSTFASEWVLETASGEQFGNSISFEINTYQPVTSTPTPLPGPTATPTADPSVSTGPVEFNYFIDDCEYPGGGTEWRCAMTITPYGGPQSDYTIWIFDGDQPSRYFGGNQVHYITSRRCSPWVHEIKVQNESNGEEATKNIYIDPTSLNLFDGGPCTEG